MGVLWWCLLWSALVVVVEVLVHCRDVFVMLVVVVSPAHVYGSVVVVVVLMFLMVVYSFGDGVLWCLRFCALVVVVVVIFMMVVCS